MAIISGWPDAVTVALLVLISFTVGIAGVYFWREFATRYRQRRLERRQQLPLHRVDLEQGDTRSISRTSTDRLNSLGQKSQKHNKYRERILAATARRPKPGEPQQAPSSYGRTTNFEDVSLQSPLVENGPDDNDKGHKNIQNSGYYGIDDKKRNPTGATPMAPSRAWAQQGKPMGNFSR